MKRSYAIKRSEPAESQVNSLLMFILESALTAVIENEINDKLMIHRYSSQIESRKRVTLYIKGWHWYKTYNQFITQKFRCSQNSIFESNPYRTRVSMDQHTSHHLICYHWNLKGCPAFQDSRDYILAKHIIIAMRRSRVAGRWNVWSN